MIDPSPWTGLRLLEAASGGNRNDVWRGRIGAEQVSVRRSRRSAASLIWELDLMGELGRMGFRVPGVVPAEDGRRVVDGIVVQDWLEGRRPQSQADWRLVARELARLHSELSGHHQRPGCCPVDVLRTRRRSVDADLDRMPADVVEVILDVFDALAGMPISVIHGDPMADNIRIGADGSVGLLDWDESRVDLTWHDLSNLGIRILDEDSHRRAQRLSNGWEAANAWTLEPDYARRRFELLLED
jgi:Ser/Thr protein kinase RdoA (MazF antagonist)